MWWQGGDITTVRWCHGGWQNNDMWCHGGWKTTVRWCHSGWLARYGAIVRCGAMVGDKTTVRCGAMEGEDLPDMGRVWNPQLPCCGWWSGVEVLGTIPGEVWRRPAPGLRIVGSGMLSPLWRFKASIVARSSFSSESCRERTEHFWKRLKTFK